MWATSGLWPGCPWAWLPLLRQKRGRRQTGSAVRCQRGGTRRQQYLQHGLQPGSAVSVPRAWISRGSSIRLRARRTLSWSPGPQQRWLLARLREAPRASEGGSPKPTARKVPGADAALGVGWGGGAFPQGGREAGSAGQGLAGRGRPSWTPPPGRALVCR